MFSNYSIHIYMRLLNTRVRRIRLMRFYLERNFHKFEMKHGDTTLKFPRYGDGHSLN